MERMTQHVASFQSLEDRQSMFVRGQTQSDGMQLFSFCLVERKRWIGNYHGLCWKETQK